MVERLIGPISAVLNENVGIVLHLGRGHVDEAGGAVDVQGFPHLCQCRGTAKRGGDRKRGKQTTRQMQHGDPTQDSVTVYAKITRRGQGLSRFTRSKAHVLWHSRHGVSRFGSVRVAYGASSSSLIRSSRSTESSDRTRSPPMRLDHFGDQRHDACHGRFAGSAAAGADGHELPPGVLPVGADMDMTRPFQLGQGVGHRPARDVERPRQLAPVSVRH